MKKLPDSRQELASEHRGLPDRVQIRVDPAVVRVDESPPRERVVPELRVEVHPVGRVEVDHLDRAAEVLMLQKRRHRAPRVGVDQPVRPIACVLVPLKAGRRWLLVLVERGEHIRLPVLRTQRVHPSGRINLLRPHQHGRYCGLPLRGPIPLKPGFGGTMLTHILAVLARLTALLGSNLDNFDTGVVGPGRAMLVGSGIAHLPTASSTPRSINAAMLPPSPTWTYAQRCSGAPSAAAA